MLKQIKTTIDKLQTGDMFVTPVPNVRTVEIVIGCLKDRAYVLSRRATLANKCYIRIYELQFNWVAPRGDVGSEPITILRKVRDITKRT